MTKWTASLVIALALLSAANPAFPVQNPDAERKPDSTEEKKARRTKGEDVRRNYQGRQSYQGIVHAVPNRREGVPRNSAQPYWTGSTIRSSLTAFSTRKSKSLRRATH